MAEGGEGKVDSVMERVQEHFFSEEFQDSMDLFVRNHAVAFADLTEAQLRGEDNQMEHWELYQQFVRLFDDKIDAYLEQEGLTSDEFYDLCRAARRTSGWDQATLFLNLILATSEYESFLLMMHEEGKDAKERQEGKAGDE